MPFLLFFWLYNEMVWQASIRNGSAGSVTEYFGFETVKRLCDRIF